MKHPLTPAGIEPATFRFVAQHLCHCATAVPLLDFIAALKRSPVQTTLNKEKFWRFSNYESLERLLWLNVLYKVRTGQYQGFSKDVLSSYDFYFQVETLLLPTTLVPMCFTRPKEG